MLFILPEQKSNWHLQQQIFPKMHGTLPDSLK